MLFGTLIGFVFAVLVLAAPSSLKWNHEEDYEYSYKFDTHLLSGLPATHSNASQTGISCQVTIQAVDDTWLHLRMIGIKYGSSSNPQTEEWTMMDSLEQRQVVSDHKEQLELPFRAQMINGICTGIVFSKNDSDWSKNWKRSIVNLISMRKSNADLGDSDTSSEAYQSRTAKTEPTIEGECEVIYTNIGKGEKKTVTKLIQFDKCVTRPGTEYGTPSNFGCKESQDGNQVKPRTTFTYQFVGNELKQSDVHSTYLFKSYGQVVFKLETRSRLIFETKRLIETEIKKVFGPKESLVYSNRKELDIEEFFKNGDDTETNPFNQTSSDSKIAELGNLVAMIPLVEKNTPETSNVVAEAVEIIRMFTIKDLKTMHSEVYIKSEKKIQVLTESILAIAGTKNTIQHLMHQIKNNTISPLRAAELLKSIQETQYPSSHIADLLIDLAHSSLAEQHESLRQSAWLAIGSIIRGFTSSNQERHLFRENSSQITKKYYRVLLKEFENANSTYKRVLALKAFGNAGLDISFNKLTQIIHDTRQQLPTRIEAVEALRLLSYRMVDQVQQILLESFQDDQYASELRSAALWRLMDTMPTESILDPIVAQMECESDQQIAAFTYQVIRHYSQSTDPCHSEFAVRCSAVLAVTRYQPQPYFLSLIAQLPIFSKDLRNGIQFNFITLFEKNAYLPKKVDVVLDSLFGGNWNKYAAQVGFSQHNFEYEVIKSIEKLNTITKTTESLSDADIETNKDANDTYAVFYFRYKNMDCLFLPIDMNTIRNSIAKYTKNKQFNKETLMFYLNQDYEFDLHRLVFISEIMRKLPTSSGVPFTVSAKIPTVFSVHGVVGTDFQHRRAHITLDATPSIISTHFIEMRFMSPMFENGVKSLQTANIYTPLRIEVIAELKTDFKLSWKVVAQENKKAIVTFTTRLVLLSSIPTFNGYSYVDDGEKTVAHFPYQSNISKVKKFYEGIGLKTTVRGNHSTQLTSSQIMTTEQDIKYILENQNLPVEFAAYLNIGRIEKASPSDFEFEKFFEKESNLEMPHTATLRGNFSEMIRTIRFEKGFRHSIVLNIEALQNFELKSEIKTVCDKKIRMCRWKLDCRRLPVMEGTEEWTLNTELVAARSQMPSSLGVLQFLEQTAKNLMSSNNISTIGFNTIHACAICNTLVDNFLEPLEKRAKSYVSYCSGSLRFICEVAIQDIIDWVYEYATNGGSRKNICPEHLNCPFLNASDWKNHKLKLFFNFYGLNYPTSPILYELGEVQFAFNVNWGNNKKNKVKLDAQFEQSEKQKEDLQKLERECDGTSENENWFKPVHLNQLNVDSEYQLTLETERTFHRIFDLIKSNKFWNVLDSRVKNDNNRVTFQFTVEQMSRQFVNITIQTPWQILEMKNVQTPQLPLLSFSRCSIRRQLFTLIDATCKVDSTIISTFDEMVYRTPLTTCYFLLAKDCIEKPTFSVFAKKLTMKGKEMMVKIVRGEEEILVKRSDVEFLVKVNDKEVDRSELEIYRIKILGDNLIAIRLPDGEVRFDGYTIKTKVPTGTSYAPICGLCGNNDGEADNEFYPAENVETKSIDEFHSSYLFQNNDCEWERGYNEKLIKKTLIKEFSDRICLSLEPVAECRSSYKAEEHKIEMVHFTCMPRHRADARRIMKSNRDQVFDMKGYPVTYGDSIKVPTSCVAH